jgi:hypothetical protein
MTQIEVAGILKSLFFLKDEAAEFTVKSYTVASCQCNWAVKSYTMASCQCNWAVKSLSWNNTQIWTLGTQHVYVHTIIFACDLELRFIRASTAVVTDAGLNMKPEALEGCVGRNFNKASVTYNTRSVRKHILNFHCCLLTHRTHNFLL